METQHTEQQARGLAEQAQRSASELASEAQEQVEAVSENVLESVASSLEDFAQEIRKQDLESLTEHVRSTAERSPGLFFAGSVATGLALARFMKSSAQRSEQAGHERGEMRRTHGEAARRPPQTPPALAGQSVRTASSPSTPPLPNVPTPRS